MVVVEGRERAGGRVWSKRLHGVDPATGAACQGVGEMGGSVITGTTCNPLAVGPACITIVYRSSWPHASASSVHHPSSS